MSEPLTSYALSRALGRDRGTIQRVVDHLAPDAYRAGRPCWNVERVAAMLDMAACDRRDAARARDRWGIRHKVLDGVLIAFEKHLRAIKAEPAPDKRHALALAVAPLLARYEASYLRIGRQLHVADDRALGLNIDFIVEELVTEIAEAAGCDQDSFFAEMNAAMVAEAH